MADSLERNMSRILLTVPAWNEEEVIEASIRTLHESCGRLLKDQAWHIEVADNGSTDATAAIVQRLACELDRLSLRHCPERGKGLAIRTSWTAGRGLYDAFVFLDADLSTDLKALPGLIAPILSGEADLVCGSRLIPGARVYRSAFRHFISWVYSCVQRTFLRLPVRDTQCGFKAASPRIVSEILPLLIERQYLFDTELLAHAAARGYAIRELPVDWSESERKSRVRPFSDGLAFLSGLRAIRQRMYLCQNQK